MKRAIICTADTDNVIELSQYLVRKDYRIISSSHTNTGKLLDMNGIPFMESEALADEPRTFGGFLSLLSAILVTGRRNETGAYKSEGLQDEEDVSVVCINIVPKMSDLHEYLDIGTSPESINTRCMAFVMASCRNFKNVLPLCDPADYHEAIIRMDTESINESYRLAMMGKAFNMLSACAAAVSQSILTQLSDDTFPRYFTFPYRKKTDLEHGSSIHQMASLYAIPDYDGAIGGIKKMQGKSISFGSYIDIDAIYASLRLFDHRMRTTSDVQSEDASGMSLMTQFTPAAGTVFTCCFKHGVPITAALGRSASESFKKTYNCGKESFDEAAAGFSSVIDEAAARDIARTNLAVVCAPGFTADARVILQVKKEMRLIVVSRSGSNRSNFRSLDGGLLVESNDTQVFDKWKFVTKSRPTQRQNDEMLFGQIMIMVAKSDSAVVVKDMATTGMCCCAMLSSDACYAALDHSTHNIQRGLTANTNAAEVLVSGSALPFDIKLGETIAGHGIRAILQPGGAKKDDEFISFCDQKGIAMIFTGMQHTVY